MAGSEPLPSSSPDQPSSGRLDSWKEIAAYMRRDVKTVQRWEKREAMPVHRHLHDKLGSVFAFRDELDVWAGVLPFAVEPGEPRADGRLREGVEPPDYITRYSRGA